MAIRIQPPDIEVPADNPFQNDLLNRKAAADVLTRIVGDIEGPCVLAIDAEWGAGKTTFLNMWSRHLQNQGFPVVAFNAWETDFAGNPMVALITEFADALGEEDSRSLKATANEIAIRILPNLFKPIPILGSAVAGAVEDTIDHFREDKVSDYQRVRDDFRQFKANLSKAAETLSEGHDDHPLVVIIDELDRCRPSYAVELLEIAKHWFMVDHIVFVLAVNRSQLAHSIKVLYGADFDADGYLGRFCDQDFRLPAPDRQEFINQLLVSSHIDQYVKQRANDPFGREIFDALYLLRCFLSLSDFDLRTVTQATHRLGLMLALVESRGTALATAAVVALILRTVDPVFYGRFVAGGVPDQEAASIVFGSPGMSNIRRTQDGAGIEAIIIVAAQPEEAHSLRFHEIDSQLLREYRSKTEDSHAQSVLAFVEEAWSQNRMFRTFRSAVQRLEMMSTDIVGR